MNKYNYYDFLASAKDIFFLLPLQMVLLSTVFLAIMEITYFKRRKLPILSTKIFSAMMVNTAVYMVLSFLCVLTINYINFFLPWFIQLVHQLYILCVLSNMLFIYLYVVILSGEQKRLNKRNSIIILSLFILSILLVFMDKYTYYENNNHIYFSGPLTTSAYSIGLIYGIMTTFKIFKNFVKNKKIFFRSKQKYVVYTNIVWIITFLIQIIYPQNSSTTVGITIMVFIMYLGLESPGDYIDPETQTLNKHALKQVLQEYTNKNTIFFIINLDIQNYPNIYRQFGDEVSHQLISEIASYISKKYHREVFHAEENSLTLIVRNTKKLENCGLIDIILNDMEVKLNSSWKVGYNNILLSSHCDFLCCPYDIPKELSVQQLIKVIDDWHSYSEESGFIRRVSTKMIEKRERDGIILKMISDAIDNDGIEMYYQPIYNIKEKKFSNVEALVRLKDKETVGFVSPEEFIPMAEKNGLIMKLSNKIFEQIFKFLSTQNLFDKGIKHVEINLSGIQSVDADLPIQMSELLKKYKINPENINLEITESTAITSGYMLKRNMEDLKKIGCTFSMDDFGTGYSNLSKIATVDFELIKIDKSLLWPAFDQKNPDQKNAKIILDNMLTMISQLGKETVIEGVETNEQFEYLEKMGATYIQGYYFSKPLNERAYLDFILQRT